MVEFKGILLMGVYDEKKNIVILHSGWYDVVRKCRKMAEIQRLIWKKHMLLLRE